MFQVTLQRRFSQVRDQSSGIEYIKQRAVAGGRSRWSIVDSKLQGPVQKDNRYIYTCVLRFQKKSGRVNDDKLVQREWNMILETLIRLGSVQRFQNYPWVIVDNVDNEGVPAAIAPTVEIVDEGNADEADVHHAMSKNDGVTLAEVKERVMPIIDDFLTNDDALTNSEYFKGIFGRNPQIRTILSSVKSFLDRFEILTGLFLG